MTVLVDTNIFLRAAQPDHPMHEVAVGALSALGERDIQLVIVPQIAVEFWTVATRPSGYNGLGLTPAEADLETERILGAFELCVENGDIFPKWRELVLRYKVCGKATHDARIVAAMQTHSISQILTFNDADFDRFAAVIDVLTPGKVLGFTTR